jgi:hypothetical protein
VYAHLRIGIKEGRVPKCSNWGAIYSIRKTGTPATPCCASFSMSGFYRVWWQFNAYFLATPAMLRIPRTQRNLLNRAIDLDPRQ